MKKQDEDLRELFTAARRADRSEAPRFRSLLEREQPVARNYGLRYAALATAATVTISVAASWLYLRAPEELIASPVPIVAEETEEVEQPVTISEVATLAPDDSIVLPVDPPAVATPEPRRPKPVPVPIAQARQELPGRKKTSSMPILKK